MSASLPVLLALYFLSALAYSVLCGLLGKTYHPLSAFQVYALALTPGLAFSLASGRLLKVWRWRRLWPPTQPETCAALSSAIILTVSTLMYLSPQSLVAILVAQAGCLLLVAKLSKPSSVALAALSIAAVGLSVLDKPAIVTALPLAYGLAKTLGYWIKIRSVENAKRGEDSERAGKAGRELVSAEDFLAAEQVLVSLLALAVAAIVSHHAPSAPLGDWRLWAVGFASLGMGLLGTRIMLRAEPSSLTFPAYRMAALLAALGASWVRGELAMQWVHWPSWLAILLACVVVGTASISDKRRQQISLAFRTFIRST